MSLNNLTRQEASERAGLISRPAYLVSLDLLDADAETFGCMTEIVFDCSSPGSETFVEYFAPTARRAATGSPTRSRRSSWSRGAASPTLPPRARLR